MVNRQSKPTTAPSASPQADPPAPTSYPDPIQDILPFGSLAIFAGASGVGKTRMLASILARIRDGRQVWGHKTHLPTGFGYIAADRPWFPTFDVTFTIAGFPEIPHYALADDPTTHPKNWTTEGAFTLLETILKKLKPVPGSLVVVDPAYPLFIKGNQNEARAVAVSLHWYRRFLTQFQITMICCANVAKERESDKMARSQDRVSGSGAFIAYSDTNIYMLDPKGEGYPTMFGWTPRLGSAEEFPVQFDPDTKLFVPYTGILPASPIEETFAYLDTQVKAVYELIPPAVGAECWIETSVLIPLVVERLEVSAATVFRYLATLDKNGLIERGHGKVRRKMMS